MALAISILSTFVGFDRQRGFYPVVLIVIASYYALFAVIGKSNHVLIIESVVIAAFILASIIGFKRNLWLVVVALIVHGVFDFFHGYMISNPGVPLWWPMFCLTYDITAAGYLASLLMRSRLTAQNPLTIREE